MSESKILNPFLHKIKGKFGDHLKRIILFGSMARDDYSAESDYDLLLVFDQLNDEWENYTENLASEVLVEYGKLISIFYLTERQLKQMKYEPFIINAQKEGILL